MKRIIILTEKTVDKKKIEDFLAGEGIEAKSISIDTHEMQNCRLCGREVFHPVKIDGNFYGGTCAKKIEKGQKELEDSGIVW